MRPSLDSVHAIVVNWNGGEGNLATLASLVADGIDERRIIVVDNGSSDGSLAAIRARFPGVQVVENEENLGFAEAANQGARAALERGAGALFFVNNDLVLRPPCTRRLVAALEREDVGFAGPRVLDARDPSRIWAAGGRLTWRANLTTLLGHGQPDGEPWRVTRGVDYVPGCALLARPRAFLAAGMFDPRYFAYMEDVDLGVRGREAGYRSLVVGEAACVHAFSSSTGGGYTARRKYMTAVNAVWFLRRHGRVAHWLRFLCFDVATLPLVWLAGVPRGRGRAALAKAKGIFDGLRGRRVTAETVRPGASRLW